MKYIFNIEGMTCAVCQSHVQKAAESVAGVTSARVNLLQNTLLADVSEENAASVSVQNIIDAVEAAGYKVVSWREEGNDTAPMRPQQDDSESDSEINHEFRKTVSALILAACVFWMGGSVKFGWPFIPVTKTPEGYVLLGLMELGFSAPVIYLYRETFKRGARALRNRVPTMDSLIFLSVGVSLTYAIYQLCMLSYVVINDVHTAHMYLMGLTFDSACMIVSLVGLGKYFEKRAKHRTTDALRSLIELAPRQATVIRNGFEMLISTDDLQVGDICIVKAGDGIPSDGEVIEGSGSCDESALTGESLPVYKVQGANVVGGTTLISGWIKVSITHIGADTELSSIVRLVEEATSSKAPVQRVADKIASIFVPTVMGLSALTFIIWIITSGSVATALNFAISVLVISCPCALGLAVPTALMVGSGRGAQLGILIKNAETLEELASIDEVVFDKTGTLTVGKPYLQHIYLADDATLTQDEALELAALIESKSSHPLAQAFTGEVDDLPSLQINGFKEIEGQGVVAVIDACNFALGNASMLEEMQTSFNGTIRSEDEDKTTLYLVKDKLVEAAFVVDDKLKATSKQAIDALNSLNVESILLSGDKESVAQRVASSLGINRVVAEVLPGDKDKEIQRLQADGAKVAMVGDGINDAPALARANVGIAIGAGRDVALDNAGVILMKSDPLDVAIALDFSRCVMRNIKQNLFWALIYNVILIPIAAGVPRLLGFDLTMNPMLGAFAMSMSSLFVVSNALRLKTWNSRWIAIAPAQDELAFDIDQVNNRVIEQFKQSDSTVSERNKEMQKVELHVEGMMCQMCVKHAREALENLDGATNVAVDLDSKSASVDLPGEVNPQIAADAVVAAGYQATVK